MTKITTIADLERVYPGCKTMSPATTAKETSTINEAYRQLIEAAPFAAVATIGPDGMDCSPRGDGPGFIKILDEKRIAIPDRRGNNRLDTLRNIVLDGRIALLLMIPGLNETLRINGRAEIEAGSDLMASMKMEGKEPASAIVMTIETMFFQCARALVRSRLWDIEAQHDASALPSAGDLLRSVIDGFDGEAYDDALPKRQAETLY